MKFTKRFIYFLLFLIILGGLFVRLYKFDNPIADWHSWRQADTSAVSRNFVTRGFDLLHPRFDDLSNIPSGKDNPNGYRFVEFPIYNVAQAGLFTLFQTFTIEQWGRLVSIFSSLLTAVFIFLLVRKYADTTAGLLAAFFYTFLPYNIYYGRTILPDPTAVMTLLGSIYFFDKTFSIHERRKKKESEVRINYFFYSLAIIFTAATFLLKPYGLFFMLPILYIAYKRFGLGLFKRWQLWIFPVITVTPLLLWRWWMTQFPEGIPANDWLLNGGNIRFKGAFFYWLFADRIGRLILGYWGFILFAFGLLSITRRTDVIKNGFFYAFLLSSLLYLFVVARGNVQHDYYQIYIAPTLAMFLGLGGSLLLSLPKEYFSRKICVVILVVSTIFTLSFGWYFVRDYFNINNMAIVTAGNEVDKVVPKDAKVLANYNGDTSFLYQTKRQGWPSYQHDMPKMIELGADYLVLVNPTEADNKFAETYKTVSKTSEYVLFDLHAAPVIQTPTPTPTPAPTVVPAVREWLPKKTQ